MISDVIELQRDTAARKSVESLSSKDTPNSSSQDRIDMHWWKVYPFSGQGGVAMISIDKNGWFRTLEYSRSMASLSPNLTLLSRADPSVPSPTAEATMHSQMVAQIQYTLITAAPPKFRCLSHWGFDVATRIWTELRSAPAGRPLQFLARMIELTARRSREGKWTSTNPLSRPGIPDTI